MSSGKRSVYGTAEKPGASESAINDRFSAHQGLISVIFRVGVGIESGNDPLLYTSAFISASAAVYGAFKAKQHWQDWLYGAILLITAIILGLKLYVR